MTNHYKFYQKGSPKKIGKNLFKSRNDTNFTLSEVQEMLRGVRRRIQQLQVTC